MAGREIKRTSWTSRRNASFFYRTPTGSEVKKKVTRLHSAPEYAATREETTDTEDDDIHEDDDIYEDISKVPRASNEMYATMKATKEDIGSDRRESQKYEQPTGKEREVSKGRKRAPKKNVDEIQDFGEMIELFKLLHIKYDSKTLDLSKMSKIAKKKIEEQSSGSGKYSFGTTGFEVIAKAKAEDMLKREKLKKLYLDVENCVKKLDRNAIEVLDIYYGNRGILKALAEQTERLTKREYNILIAGESSAGKSSLLNLILGEELLAHHVLNTTSTICELKFGRERKVVVHYKYDKEQKTRPLPTIHKLETEEECGKNFYDQIAPFVRMESGERHKGSNYARVEIFWPHELLEEGVVIIDSPGLGESDEMDEVLIKYLPNAFAFIYVLDISHAGGIQKDMKEKLIDILKKVQLSDGGVENLQHLAACSLFIGNKWDQVSEDQRPTVKKYIVTKLSECWEDANLNHQIVYMSIKEAIKAQEYGGVTEEFNDLLQKIKTMVLKAINIRLYNHWQWLYVVLHHIHRVTYFLNQEIQSSEQKTRDRMQSIEKRMEKIEKQEQDVRRNMETRVQDRTKVLYDKLDKYIFSTEFKTKLCTWINCPLPPTGKNWETTKSNIKKAIDYRFKELLIQWENDHHVYAEIHRQLLDEFRIRLNLLDEELQSIDKEMHRVEKRDDYVKNKSKISTATKVLFGATSPLWFPFGVVGLVIGMPVLGVMAIQREVSQNKKFGDYQNDRQGYMERRSEKYLKQVPKEFVLEYAQRQMENTRMVLSKYGDQIPILLEANRKLVKQLTNETRSQGEVLKMYDPIQKRSVRIIDNIIPLGIELCPATVNASDLHWKEDGDSCLGRGEHSTVYKGKLKNAGGAKSEISEMNVAVKIFKNPFDGSNTRFFLYEEVQIRDLEHKNVLKYFGAARISDSLTNIYKFIFVTKACRENLRNVIFKNPRLTPAEAENNKQAIDKFILRAIDIAEGLNYIHERGLIHRHLKLENILVDEEGTLMISDVGIVGRFLETEKSIIYLAPEVLEVLTNRTKEADIYSFGIVLWEMWYGIQAFEELVPIKKGPFQKMIANGKRPKSDAKIINIPAIQAVMEKCWATKAEKRYSAKECCEKFRELKNGDTTV